MSLHSLKTAENFYKQFDFVKTNHPKDRMMHYELDSGSAIKRLEKMGLI